MKAQLTNPAILRKLGLEALCKSLGPLGMVRFLQQYETGIIPRKADFWLKDSDIESIAIELKNRHKRKPGNSFFFALNLSPLSFCPEGVTSNI